MGGQPYSKETMYKDLDEDYFTIQKDDAYQQQLRMLASLPDANRPPEDRFLERFYASLSDDKAPSSRVLPHSDVFYVRAALEDRFPDRKFTIDEVKRLLLEEFGLVYT